MIIDGSECKGIALPKLLDLDVELAGKICNLTDWTVAQACCVAFDKWPTREGNEKNVYFNDDREIAKRIFRLKFALKLAIDANRITSRKGRSNNSESIDYVEPRDFAIWLHQLPHCEDIHLYRHFEMAIPLPLINNRASISDIPDEIKNEIDIRYPDPGSKECWAEVRYIQYVAKNYMQRQIDEAHCKCRHDKLAKFVYDNFIWENTPLIESDIMNRNLFESLKETALLVVPPERRFGWRDENNIMHYRKAACLCEIPSHR